MLTTSLECKKTQEQSVKCLAWYSEKLLYVNRLIKSPSQLDICALKLEMMKESGRSCGHESEDFLPDKLSMFVWLFAKLATKVCKSFVIYFSVFNKVSQSSLWVLYPKKRSATPVATETPLIY